MPRSPDHELDALQATWQAAWQPALELWSRFVKLREPTWCLTQKAELKAGLSDSFAMIRLHDHTVVISLRRIRDLALQGFALEILAHEIGHHVYCPADLTDNARLAARIRAGLPTKEHLASFIGNLYSDLLINDRLQRSVSLNISGVYQQLGGGSHDRLWTLYMRTYELLWNLPPASQACGPIDARLNQDAQLAARLVRSYARDWLDGAGRFAALCLPYLLEDDGQSARKCLTPWLDTARAGCCGVPDGIAQVDSDELEGAIHPAEDPELSGIQPVDDESGSDRQASQSSVASGQKTAKRYREPIEYVEVLRAAGVDVDEKQLIVNYYRERAWQHLIPFPSCPQPDALDPLPEGYEVWDIDAPISEIDWLGSLLQGSQVIPGITTRRRIIGSSPQGDPAPLPVDLYLGVDCSGSMNNPARHLSYPVLAGAIIALSALRSGSQVKVVLSGEPGRSVATDGFVRQSSTVLGTLTDYLGTGYAFGIHRLRETFERLPTGRRPVHILIVSDNDMFSMLDERDASGQSGWDVAATALQQAGGGGTFVLELPEHVRSHSWRQDTSAYLERMRAIGWSVDIVASLDQLVRFARDFSRRRAGLTSTS